MTAQGLSKSEMAKRMNTSRAQLDRLLDPENDKVQLDTVQRAASRRVTIPKCKFALWMDPDWRD